MSASHKHPACAKGSDLNNRFDYREFGNPLSITTRLAFDSGARILSAKELGSLVVRSPRRDGCWGEYEGGPKPGATG